MKIVIVANGILNDNEVNRRELSLADTIICADGGANRVSEMGFVPDYLIGDMDSVEPGILEKLNKSTRVITEESQETTDLEKALRLAEKKNPTHITIIGAIGSSFDHTISNVYCLCRISDGIKARIVDEKNEVYLVKDMIELEGKTGDIVSVIPINEVKGLSYEGLRWSLKGYDASPPWFGTRNQMTGSRCRITLTGGIVIVVKSR